MSYSHSKDRVHADLPGYGWLGLFLCLAAWVANWCLPGLRTHILFFPQWLGYVLLVDAWTWKRTGSSCATRSARLFAGQFVISIPLWWLFEVFNKRLGNWEYLGAEHFSNLEYFLLATLSFSTVLPAVLGSAEWFRSFESFRFQGPRLRPTPRFGRSLVLLGGAMLLLMLAFPRQCFPFCWTSLVLILEGILVLRGRRSLCTELVHGDWTLFLSLWAGGLLCGFFWEFWNHWSYPKWIYHIPYVGFGKVFEMPVLGYLGYLPFAHELYLFWILLSDPQANE